MITTRKGLIDLYQIVKNKYWIDQDNILIGGFSWSVIVALDAVMSIVFPIKGIIGVSTYDRSDSFNKKNIKMQLKEW